MARGLYALEPAVVHALVPDQRAGAYLLLRGGRPTYAGRSDRNLRRRLLTHALDRRADQFAFQLHTHARAAYDVECALFHGFDDASENLIHPASPAGAGAPCFICQTIRAAPQL